MFTTPATPPGQGVKFEVVIPSGFDYLALFLGALSELTTEGMWREEGIPQMDAIQAFSEVIVTVRRSISHIGFIVPIIQGAAPPGTLVCDGSTKNTADYPELYAVLPAALQHGTTFTLPDLRGRMLIPSGQGPGGVPNIPLYDVLTHETVTLSVDNLPPHSHTYNEALSIPTAAGEIPTVASEVNVFPSATGSVGSGTPIDIRPSHIGLLFVIVAKDTLP